MSTITSRRAGFGTSFARRHTARVPDQSVATILAPASGKNQDRLSCFGEPVEHGSLLESADVSFNVLSNASSLSNSLPASINSSPSATTTPGHVDQQQLLSHQILQLSGNIATCVHQNELVISLLMRLVASSESIASRRNLAGHSKAQIASPSSPTGARFASDNIGVTKANASSKTDHNYVFRHTMGEVMTVQQTNSNMLHLENSLNTLYQAPVFETWTGSATEMQHIGGTEGLLSKSHNRRETALTATPDSSLHEIEHSGSSGRGAFDNLPITSAAITADEQTNHAPLICYTSMSGTPASLYMTENGQQRLTSRRTSLCISKMTQRDGSDITTFTSIDSMQCLLNDQLPPQKRKRVEIEEIDDSSKESRSTAPETDKSDWDIVGHWQDWQVPRQQPLSVSESLPRAKHRTLREVRAEIKASSNRPSGSIGRIPLKQYLEVSGPDECRAVRRLGRKLYMAWLEPNTRFRKQENARLMACVNRIEHDFPVLADCEGHWKARQLMLQIIDNSIDEHKSSERRNTKMPEASANDVPSRRRGRPKGTTAAVMAQTRQEHTLADSGEPGNESIETDSDNDSDSSDSETDV